MRFADKIRSLTPHLVPVTPKHIVLNQDNTDQRAAQFLGAMDVDAQQLSVVASHVAVEAAKLVARRREALQGATGHVDATATKTSDVDPVTVVDQESERLIRQMLMDAAPGSVVLGEEQGQQEAEQQEAGQQGSRGGGDQSVLWIVDPIDGTVNFMYGVPAFAVSVAATVDGIPVAGAVADVTAQRVYSAHIGAAVNVSSFDGEESYALVHTGENGEPSDRTDRADVPDANDNVLSTCLLATGFAYDASRRKAQAELLTAVLPSVRDIRRLGSAALDLVRVATGEVDGYYEHGLGPWDHAAGSLIAARAGAQVMMPGFEVMSSAGAVIIATSPSAFDALEKLVNPAGTGGVLHPLNR